MRGLGLAACLLIASVPAVASAEIVARRTFRTSDGVNLSALEAGVRHNAEGAPTIAFIPGWCMPAALWRRQLEALAASYYTIALDPRGQANPKFPPKATPPSAVPRTSTNFSGRAPTSC